VDKPHLERVSLKGIGLESPLLSELPENEIGRPATDGDKRIPVGAERGHDLGET